MPKVSVYLSQDLYDRAKQHDLPISALAQVAIEAALSRRGNDQWLARLRAHPPRVRKPYDISDLMDEVRDEFGT